MATHRPSNVGVLTPTHPATAAPAAGTEVTTPGSTLPVPTPGGPAGSPAGSPPATPPIAGAVAGVKTLRLGLVPLRDTVAPYILTMLPGTEKRYNTVTTARRAAIPRIADVLRQHPTLAPQVDPDVLDAESDAADAMELASNDLLSLGKQLGETARLIRYDSWKGASVAYDKAVAQAKTDKPLANEIAPLRALLKKGPRSATAPATSSATATQAAKAQARAARAQQRANAARASEARAAEASAARNTRHGAPLPAASPPVPVPASVYQGPSASVEAQGTTPGANPQGPAAGR